jgi:hypothetical protein
MQIIPKTQYSVNQLARASKAKSCAGVTPACGQNLRRRLSGRQAATLSGRNSG